MGRYKILLFDADGTLFDFERSEREAVADVMRAFSIDPSEENITLYSKINDSLWKALERGEIDKVRLRYKRFEDFCDTLGIVRDTNSIAERYTEELSKKSYLIPGAYDLISSLYGKYRMFIVTNGIKKVQTERFYKSGIDRYIEGLFISEEIGYEKPNIEYFKKVFERIENFDAQSALIVGDSLTSDILGGVRAGIDTCWYNPHGKTADAELSAKIKYTVSSFEEIEKIVLGE